MLQINALQNLWNTSRCKIEWFCSMLEAILWWWRVFCKPTFCFKKTKTWIRVLKGWSVVVRTRASESMTTSQLNDSKRISFLKKMVLHNKPMDRVHSSFVHVPCWTELNVPWRSRLKSHFYSEQHHTQAPNSCTFEMLCRKSDLCLENYS